MLLPRRDGRLADFLLGVADFECPKGHAGELGAQVEFDFDALTVMSFRETLSRFLRDFEHDCAKCGRKVREEGLAAARFFYAFEDLAGTAIAWWTREAGAFHIGYHAETKPDRLLAARPAKLSDLVPVTHTDLRNDDCRGALGRVFSLRTRWLEFLERFAQTQKTLVETPAPGLAIGLHTNPRAAEFRAILGVLVPGYDPRERHVHVPLEAPGGAAPGSAAEWMTPEARRRIEEYAAVPIAVVDRWEAWGQAGAQAARLGMRIEDRDGPALVNRDGLTLAFDFEEIPRRAVRQCRTLGEQAFIALAPPATALSRAERVVDLARAAGPAEVRPDWTLAAGGRSVDLARLVEEADPETEEGRKLVSDRLGLPVG